MNLCPYCNGEMVEGYIPFNTPLCLNWKSINNKKDKIRVSDSVKIIKINKISKVFYCEQCEVMIKHTKR